MMMSSGRTSLMKFLCRHNIITGVYRSTVINSGGQFHKIEFKKDGQTFLSCVSLLTSFTWRNPSLLYSTVEYSYCISEALNPSLLPYCSEERHLEGVSAINYY